MAKDSGCCLKWKDSKCSEGELLTFDDLEEEQSLQIRYIQPDADYFCAKHLRDKINLFLFNERRCLDPLNKHQKVVRKRLKVVTMGNYKKFKSRIILVPGQKLCGNCLFTSIPEWFEGQK